MWLLIHVLFKIVVLGVGYHKDTQPCVNLVEVTAAVISNGLYELGNVVLVTYWAFPFTLVVELAFLQ